MQNQGSVRSGLSWSKSLFACEMTQTATSTFLLQFLMTFSLWQSVGNRNNAWDISNLWLLCLLHPFLWGIGGSVVFICLSQIRSGVTLGADDFKTEGHPFAHLNLYYKMFYNSYLVYIFTDKVNKKLSLVPYKQPKSFSPISLFGYNFLCLHGKLGSQSPIIKLYYHSQTNAVCYYLDLDFIAW